MILHISCYRLILFWSMIFSLDNRLNIVLSLVRLWETLKVKVCFFFVSFFKPALHSVIFELIEISRLQRLHCCFSETMMNGAGGFSSGSRTLVAQAQVWGRVDPEFRISTAPFNLCSKRTWSIG